MTMHSTVSHERYPPISQTLVRQSYARLSIKSATVSSLSIYVTWAYERHDALAYRQTVNSFFEVVGNELQVGLGLGVVHKVDGNARVAVSSRTATIIISKSLVKGKVYPMRCKYVSGSGRSCASMGISKLITIDTCSTSTPTYMNKGERK